MTTTENMEGDWFFYCNDSTTVEGPHTWEQLLELHGNGAISHATAICRAGSEEWISFANFLPTLVQVRIEQTGIAEEASWPTGDPIRAATVVQRKSSGLTPKRWATVVSALLAVAIVAYSGLRFLSPDEEKAPVANTSKIVEPSAPQTTVSVSTNDAVLIDAPTNTISVSTDDAVLIEKADGSTAVVQLTSFGGGEATYKWRFRDSPSAAITVGTGRVFEDYERVQGSNMVIPRNNREDLLIKAGTIQFEWSASSWFYIPNQWKVTILSSADYDSKP